MQVRLAEEAEDDLQSIWLFVATESANTEIADGLIDRVKQRLFLLTHHLYLGRSRADDLGHGTRSLNEGEYVIVYTVEPTEIQVLRIIHGRRDLPVLFDI